MGLKLGTTDINKVYIGSAEIQKVYKGTAEIYSAGPTLRNIQIGDDLSGKKLYLSFPNDYQTNLSYMGAADVITCAGGHVIFEREESWEQGTGVSIIENVNYDYLYYYYYTWELEPPEETLVNQPSLTLASNFGVVTAINTDSNAYQYIMIEE